MRLVLSLQLIRSMKGSSKIEDFKMLQKLREDSDSSVFRVKRLIDQQQYALKVYKLDWMSSKSKIQAINEVRLSASIDSQFIAGYKDAFCTPQGKKMLIVKELVSTKNLQDVIKQNKQDKKQFPQKEIWKVTTHICTALTLLHNNGMLHRDLKPLNIVVDGQGNYVITDLTCCEVKEEQKEYEQTGTPFYSPPQVWKEEPYGPKSDIWSLGCTLYELCTGNKPFEAPEMRELSKTIAKGQFQNIPQSYSKDLSVLIAECLSVKMEDRPSAQQVIAKVQKLRELDHQFEVNIPQQTGKITLLAPLQRHQKEGSAFDLHKIQLPDSQYSSLQPPKSESKEGVKVEGNE